MSRQIQRIYYLLNCMRFKNHIDFHITPYKSFSAKTVNHNIIYLYGHVN